ncbi:MAG: Inositol-5-monophosphate dehydrogenase [Candidatus Berkelbacteria bacterium]|nr:Inositol-5-monophosphate dehydrogenase [Candidatus Berkelbacteria bacterium]
MPNIENLKLSLTFDDVLLLPGYTDFSREEIDLSCNLTRKIKLEAPLVSAPMDKVTESRLAIALAKSGGIGIIHRNLPIKDQVREVLKVKSEHLLVGAAISSQTGFEERTQALIKAKTDVVVIDSAHGFSQYVIDCLRTIKKRYPKTQVIAGNVATYEGARALIGAGADGLRVGMGPGSICSTRVISGMGVHQITAIIETSRAAKNAQVPIIADGGIQYSGCIIKALAAGASSVMMGSLFSQTLEAPGKVVYLDKDNVPSRFKSIWNNKKANKYPFKEYRGMGSIGAMEKGIKIKSEGEFHNKEYKKTDHLIAEGIEGLVPVKGSVSDLVEQLIGGVKSGFYYVGAKTVSELWQKGQFIQITQASLKESHPHDILITNPGKNYL